MSPTNKSAVLIPDSDAAARYRVHKRTLQRWDQIPDVGFPPPVQIRGRRYREVAALDAWDVTNSRRAAQLIGERQSVKAKPAGKSTSGQIGEGPKPT